MTPDKYQRLKPLFEQALDTPAGQRSAFILKIRIADEELGSELARLVESHDDTGDDGTPPTRSMEAPLIRFHDVFPDAFPGDNASFAPGEMLLDRFRIVRFIGRGGMGEVYEAEDIQLGRVALKTIRSNLADKPGMLARFRKEVRLALRVTSPGVCRIHALFSLPATDLRGAAAFLTMEFLEGETLAERIDRDGALPLPEARTIALQLCAAVQAIHDAGVIHRDLKSRNLMLVPRKGALQVVVMDLGLARDSATTPDGDAGLTLPGAVMGTTHCMAPEQFEGKEATPATDIYALGVLLYEIVTGKPPFIGGPPIAAAVRRAKRPAPPSLVRDNLPRQWDVVIDRCLEYDAEKRYQSATAVAEALRSESVYARLLAAGKHPVAAGISRRTAIGGGAFVAVAIAGRLLWPDIDQILHPLPEKRYVALMAWPDAPGPDIRSVLSEVLEAIGANLSRAEASTKDLLILRPSDTGNQAPREPGQAMSLLGVNLVLGASVQIVRDAWALTLRVLDAGTSRTLRETRISSPARDWVMLPERAALAAAGLLQIRSTREPEASELSGVNPAAWQAFTSAEEFRLEPNDAGLDRAIASYQKALDAQPRFALCYANLAIAYVRKYQLGHEDAALLLARTNAERSMEIDFRSPRSILSRALVDLYFGRISEAMDSLARIQNLDPGNTQILMYQAKAFADLGREADEEACYRRILAERPNFWLAYNELGAFYHRHGKDEEAAVEFEKASAVAPQVVMPLINAGSMYYLLKRRPEAAEAFEKSLRASPNELAYINLGNLAFEDKNYPKALGFYEKAKDLNPRDHQIFRDIGDCYDALGRPSLVQANYARAADLLEREVKMNPRPGRQWMRLAFYDAKAGRRGKAEADIRAGDERGAPEIPAQLFKAQAEAVLGRSEEALRLVLECLSHGVSTVDVDLALDLKVVRMDPRYKSAVNLRLERGK